ncbi:DUF3977 family protein [Streptococcus dysgalactiae subsp. equisimilis]|uniref:DUF3977 family protein n=1 Tax=Streptococcus dysgalactiae TaxID=1334 RepID=UPI0002FFF5CE|nr:DUF3977 family protein [Streptococcus dysgalactiae]KKC18680.1 hypothetical protein WH81_00930 [Streptococcus dysgalactiae subsp. equisimilis]MCY7195565.1 DUF3977 family protein [Streptococcus dysgalactiae]MCY7199870.1 DUF3977 family protein [Streptococcus dysgalactiae]MCY7205904.1 DUF3977 family protein [Streptococcus dysgalactiae]MCY7215265.1 DUF3977 family protein [Streptococcus dysgalactiae]
MTKYIEIGLGNSWLVRTEYEKDNGTEVEVRGISGAVHPRSIYLRIWLGYTVWILDFKEGFKQQTKSRKSFKCVVGIVSEL